MKVVGPRTIQYVKAHLTPSSALAPTRFRSLLRAELARRSQNPRYSLRAFALDLGIDHSSLSQLMRGLRPFTERMIRDLGARLGLDQELIEASVARERSDPACADNRLDVVRQLTADALAVLSEFEHYAILELTHLDDFRADVRWIARVLDVSSDRVNIVLQRLCRLGMLEMTGPSEWIDRFGDVTTVLDTEGAATVRHLAREVESRTWRAGGEPVEASSTTLAIDRELVPEARTRIARFRRDLLELLTAGGRRDGVYRFEVRLEPLTRNPETAET